MAQLPPKVPNMTPNWPDFSHHHQRMPSIEHMVTSTTTATTNNNIQNPSWVDEFLDFSSTKRGSHRRSVSDSIAFLDTPMVLDDCQGPSTPASGTTTSEFDRFDDAQFMSMFNDDVAAAMPMPVGPTLSGSNPSSPSDHNSINDGKLNISDQQQVMQLKAEAEEVDSSCKSNSQVTGHATLGNPNDKIIDPKRIKRILANRQSAQRSRVRKLQYISELERRVSSLQAEVSVLSPRVAFLDHQRLVLNVDNSVLKQRIAALAQDKIFKDAHQEALKREIEILRQVYCQQNLKKKAEAQSPVVSDAKISTEKEQLVN